MTSLVELAGFGGVYQIYCLHLHKAANSLMVTKSKNLVRKIKRKYCPEIPNHNYKTLGWGKLFQMLHIPTMWITTRYIVNYTIH